MRAFLSHSSRDKGFVEAVADCLRPGTFEIDSLTFDAGLVNSEAIIDALNRSDLFCLFLSTNSVNSSYVDFEVLLGMEFLAKGTFNRFVAICLDEDAFEAATRNARFFNIVRKSIEPESAARLIQGHLITAAQERGEHVHPFVGREADLLELERQITNHQRPISKAIFVSGNPGSGRRTAIQKFYGDQFPQVGSVFPPVQIDPFTGQDELYKKILIALRPTITAGQLRTYIQSFNIASEQERTRLISQLFNSLLTAREAAYVIDTGGLLTDSGSLTIEIDEVVSELDCRPHPPVIFIGTRMIPKSQRRKTDDISYLGLKSLNRDASSRLVSKLLRDRDIHPSDDELEALVRLSDGHPYNFYRLASEVDEQGLQSFLANPRDFIEWKHRQSSEYINKINFDVAEMSVLALLVELPELDFESIVSALALDVAAASNALQRLREFHVVESEGDAFRVAPAVRIAVERDPRIRLPAAQRKSAISKLAQSLQVRIEDGTVPVRLVDAAILSALEADEIKPGFASVFLLPSHYVWLAKRHYDLKHWEESIRLAKEALKRTNRLSLEGRVAAYRYLCLSAARLGRDEDFDIGIRDLEQLAHNSWSRSNIAFLRGFNLRLKGNLPKAEEQFKRAYALSPGNISAARELAAICLMRNRLDQAEEFAREAHSHARSNAYLLDILLAVLIRKHGRDARKQAEINEIFESLHVVDQDSGRSFYTTRKAQLEHLSGDNREALRLIRQAISKTPRIFEPHRLCAEILLKDGNKSKALEQIEIMKDIVNARDPNERRTNYRLYLETYAHYLTEIGRYDEAKGIFADRGVFEENERLVAVKEIETVQAYRLRR